MNIPEPQKSKILVIDDTPKNLQVVASELRDSGYDVLAATGGQQGIDIARAKSPDLVLLDIMMPEMDGYAVCDALKSHAETQGIPVIFLTAANETENIVRGFEHGAVDYVVKPFNKSELLARVKTQLEIKRQGERINILSMAVQQSANSILITDPEGKIVFANRHFLEKTGYSESEIIGENPRILKSGNQSDEFYKNLWETITSGGNWRGELCNKTKTGDMYWELSSITSIRNEKEEVLYFLAIQEDITERKRLEGELYRQSTTDSMTDACNRRTGLEILEKMLHLSKRQNRFLTICFIDLNNLKFVNDTFGHKVGDEYILLVNEILKSILRKSDTLARLGGDEFLVILPNCMIDKARELIKHVTGHIETINTEKRYPFTASIACGFAQFDPRDDPNHEALIEMADNEMYAHKKMVKKS